MKKIFNVFAVLLALGMLFVSCQQQAEDMTKEATAADLDGDTSWIVGTWELKDFSYEIKFDADSPYTDEMKKQMEEQYKKDFPSLGETTEITEADKDDMVKFLKSEIGELRIKLYINGAKTKMTEELTQRIESAKMTIVAKLTMEKK